MENNAEAQNSIKQLVSGQNDVAPNRSDSSISGDLLVIDEPENAEPKKLLPIEEIMKNFSLKEDQNTDEYNIQKFDFTPYLKK